MSFDMWKRRNKKKKNWSPLGEHCHFRDYCEIVRYDKPSECDRAHNILHAQKIISKSSNATGPTVGGMKIYLQFSSCYKLITMFKELVCADYSSAPCAYCQLLCNQKVNVFVDQQASRRCKKLTNDRHRRRRWRRRRSECSTASVRAYRVKVMRTNQKKKNEIEAAAEETCNDKCVLC